MPAGLTAPPLRLPIRNGVDIQRTNTDMSLNPNDFITPASSPREGHSLPPLGSPLSVGRQRLDAFHIVCLIGKGGFGQVFMVRHKATAAVYAMKIMDKEGLIQRKAVSDAHAERNILAMVGQTDAPFIVRLHAAFQTSRRVYLVMDFASGGELMFHLRREAMLSEDEARFYAAELLIALETLHNMGIVHRDIKPENILLDAGAHLLLTDFGLAKELIGDAEMNHSWCGSDDYMAPEIIGRARHTGKPADYWAYGIFIFDCLCGHPPFSPSYERGKLSRKRLHDRILKQKIKFPTYLSRECLSLLRQLLNKNASKRLTDSEEIRAHPWFASINWDALRRKEIQPPILLDQSSPTACFSPTLTRTSLRRVDLSAPHSPEAASASRSAPIAINSTTVTDRQVADAMWQGFSFVAPGMEFHFELSSTIQLPTGPSLTIPSPLPPIIDPALELELGAAFVPPSPSPLPDPTDWEDAVVAEFEAEAKKATEIDVQSGEI